MPFRISRWLILGIVCSIVNTGCSDYKSGNSTSSTAINDSLLMATYPELYDAIDTRDDSQVLPFTNHEHATIRAQAWRAMAHTPVDSLSQFITRVEEDDSDEAWLALSLHSLGTDQLRSLEESWLRNTTQRNGINLVFGQQGDANTLQFLSNQIEDAAGSSYEQSIALAISRLMTRFESTQVLKFKVIRNAFQSTDSQVVRSWLYGFYRGGDDMLSGAMKDSLISEWGGWGKATSANVDQYVAGIAGPDVFSDLVSMYDSAGTLYQHVQLGIELARMSADIELTSENIEALKKLLENDNPHVAQQVLAGLSGRLDREDELTSFIKSAIADNDNASAFVWIAAVNALAEIDYSLISSYSNQLENMGEENPYLYPQIFSIWSKTESMKAFLDRLKETINQGDPLKSMYAVDALNNFWGQLDGVDSEEIREKVRELTFKSLAIRDRGVTYSTQPLLRDTGLFSQSDFSRINSNLNTFELPGDIEVYQTFGSLYKDRFEEQARPVIDSLSALGYSPLNRSLRQAGWEVQVKEEGRTEFRKPDWGRLWELGPNPIWVLETEEGTIKVKMNTLSAPATVSAIDSLTRSGSYDGIPFHRVVPNFVIQGGDIERRDGFGGPDFTIPTEASELGYRRGAAGIASAGPDTEGSQYFFMHQWKPHLNGRYTLFGHVIEGMEIVDRIVAGDRVIRAYWE